MSKPDEEIEDTEGKSKWAPGQNADGSIAIYTPDEAAKLLGERDADEEAFDEMLEPDDMSDLDDDDSAVLDAIAEAE